MVAFDRGSMPELVDHGTTGYLVDGIEQATAGVEQVDSLDRGEIRATAIGRFDRAAMIDRYVRVYRSVLQTRAGVASPG